MISTLLFDELKNISNQLSTDINTGRETLIKFIDKQLDKLIDNQHDSQLIPIVYSLLEKAGLYQYMQDNSYIDFHQKLLLELHKPLEMEDYILHEVQGNVYRLLLDGENVILSAPTSFGKSLLIDAVIASQYYSNIVIIVPSIALIEETRERITEKFSQFYKIISFPSQKIADKNIFIFTQERFLEANIDKRIDFFVIDEFYKLNANDEIYKAKNESRIIALNEAFYRLLKEKCQFFMIGPNIGSIKEISKLNARIFNTDFKTVAANVIQMGKNGCPKEVSTLCKTIEGQTLIFCKSSKSISKLGKEIITELSINQKDQELLDFIEWLEINYSRDWSLIEFLRYGIGVHHSGLPRSISQYVLHLFNNSKLKFLLCTSTIIEGVNTSAKNMIIYDNRIANKKFDLFTFNNIKGRAGRMFKHFVGNIYLHDVFKYHESLPIVDIPILGEQQNMPKTLLLGMEESDLSDGAKERLRYLHAQSTLPYEIIKNHNDIHPDLLLKCANKINAKLTKYNDLLSWKSYPDNKQIYCISYLVFSFLCSPDKRGNGAVSSKQLAYRLISLQKAAKFETFIKAQIENTSQNEIDKEIENCLKFIRNWCDYILPATLSALNDIQQHVFSQANMIPGDYSFYIQNIKNYFDKPFCSSFEELGLPIQIYSKLPMKINQDTQIDDLMASIKTFPSNNITDFLPFETRILQMVQKSI